MPGAEVLVERNCGVCIHSNEEDGRFCEHPDLAVARGGAPEVGIARSSSMSPCGSTARLWEPCRCLAPYCPRHGQDRRR